MKTVAIIPSGGTGSRTGQSIPKQYIRFKEKELIAFTLEVFQKNELVDEIIVSAQKEFFPLLEEIKSKFNITKLIQIIEGGDSRQSSVYNGLILANAKENDLIAVHDAARPLLPQKVLTEAIKKAKLSDSVLVAIKAQDTLVQGSEKIANHLDRDKIFYAQTPQIFRYKILKDAMEKANLKNFIGTDESMLVKKAGYNVHISEGSSLNFKVTTEYDLELFKSRVFDQN